MRRGRPAPDRSTGHRGAIDTLGDICKAYHPALMKSRVPPPFPFAKRIRLGVASSSRDETGEAPPLPGGPDDVAFKLGLEPLSSDEEAPRKRRRGPAEASSDVDDSSAKRRRSGGLGTSGGHAAPWRAPRLARHRAGRGPHRSKSITGSGNGAGCRAEQRTEVQK